MNDYFIKNEDALSTEIPINDSEVITETYYNRIDFNSSDSIKITGSVVGLNEESVNYQEDYLTTNGRDKTFFNKYVSFPVKKGCPYQIFKIYGTCWFESHSGGSSSYQYYILVGLIQGVQGGDVWGVSTDPSKGTANGYVYSTTFSSYPTNGVSGKYWYDSITTITSPTDPSNVSYAQNMTPGYPIIISWTAAVSKIPSYSIQNYEVEYAVNDSSSFTSAGTTTQTSYTFTIPSGTNKIRFRVRAKDTNNQYSSYTTGNWSNLWNFSGFTYSSNDLLYNSSITLSWGLSGPDFKLERKSSSDSDWVQVYSGSNTSFSETVGFWENVQYRIQAYNNETAIGELEYSDILTVYYANKNIQMNYKESNGLYSLLYPNIEPMTTSNILLSTNSVSSYSNKVTLDDLLLTTTTSQQGEYTGTGNYGQENPNKLNFSLRPILLEIEDKVTGEKMDDSKVNMKYNSDSVEWYSGNTEDQMNESGKVYVYRAVLMNNKV